MILVDDDDDDDGEAYGYDTLSDHADGKCCPMQKQSSAQIKKKAI